MKMKKKMILLTIALTAFGLANAQNTEKTMQQDTLKTTMQKIENGVVAGYKAIENGVVSGYNAIENGVVEGFTRVSDAFVMKFIALDGETLEQTKARIRTEEEHLRQKNEEILKASRQRSQETIKNAKQAGNNKPLSH